MRHNTAELQGTLIKINVIVKKMCSVSVFWSKYTRAFIIIILNKINILNLKAAVHLTTARSFFLNKQICKHLQTFGLCLLFFLVGIVSAGVGWY